MMEAKCNSIRLCTIFVYLTVCPQLEDRFEGVRVWPTSNWFRVEQTSPTCFPPLQTRPQDCTKSDRILPTETHP